MNRHSRIFIITAPSGTGKSTINRKLVNNIQNLSFSVSVTTRRQRANEVHGEHYWFIDQDTFKSHIKEQNLVEHAEVFGNFYGTTFEEIERLQSQNLDIIVEIDIKA